MQITRIRIKNLLVKLLRHHLILLVQSAADYHNSNGASASKTSTQLQRHFIMTLDLEQWHSVLYVMFVAREVDFIYLCDVDCCNDERET